MIKNDFYYVDKTGMIKELLENRGSVNLFIRPRRFGKSLNMDMLKCFFEIGADKSLFDGLAISKEKKLCETYMGKYPVLIFSLKEVKGFNNPKMHTILDERYDEWFGFTDEEAKEMLRYYGREDKYALTKEWYDGYLFGKTYVYCPRDVVNWCDKLANTTDTMPENFWAHTSGDQMIRRFADKAEGETKAELERLLEGGTIWKKVNMDLTYNELDASVENLWSVLFITGYLTFKGRNEKGEYELVIPNREIKSLFQDIFERWFKEKIIGNREAGNGRADIISYSEWGGKAFIKVYIEKRSVK